MEGHSAADIDLVSNHPLRVARTTTTLLIEEESVVTQSDEDSTQSNHHEVGLGMDCDHDVESPQSDDDVVRKSEEKKSEDHGDGVEAPMLNIVGQEKMALDPATCTAVYDPMRNTLNWSNGTRWIAKDFQVFVGQWRDPHGDRIEIDEDGLCHYITPKLGTFQSRVVGFCKIAVRYDDNMYFAKLLDDGRLRWDNGSTWKRVGDQHWSFYNLNN